MASVLQDKVLQTDGGDGRCNAGSPGQVPAPGIVQKNRQGGPAGATCRLLLTAREASAAAGRSGQNCRRRHRPRPGNVLPPRWGSRCLLRWIGAPCAAWFQKQIASFHENGDQPHFRAEQADSVHGDSRERPWEQVLPRTRGTALLPAAGWTAVGLLRTWRRHVPSYLHGCITTCMDFKVTEMYI